MPLRKNIDDIRRLAVGALAYAKRSDNKQHSTGDTAIGHLVTSAVEQAKSSIRGSKAHGVSNQ